MPEIIQLASERLDEEDLIRRFKAAIDKFFNEAPSERRVPDRAHEEKVFLEPVPIDGEGSGSTWATRPKPGEEEAAARKWTTVGGHAFHYVTQRERHNYFLLPGSGAVRFTHTDVSTRGFGWGFRGVPRLEEEDLSTGPRRPERISVVRLAFLVPQIEQHQLRTTPWTAPQ